MFSHKINNTDYIIVRIYTSCVFVTLQVLVYCVKLNASIRLYQTDFKIHDVHVCGKPARLFSPMLFDIERGLFSIKKTEWLVTVNCH